MFRRDSRQASRGGRPSTTPVGNSKFSSAFNPTPLPARPTTVYGFAEMDVLSPADVLRRHLNVFNSANTGNLPSLKPKRHNLTLLKPRTPYRVADMVKVGIDRAHRLTPSRSSPSKRHISSIMVLYTHDSRFLEGPTATKKVTADELEPLVGRTGFALNELLRFSKLFQKLLSSPLTRGVDLQGFGEFMAKFGHLDSHDDQLNKRLFDVQNTRGGYHLEFERCVELLHLLKKADTVTKAKLFYTLVDEGAGDRLSLNDIDCFFGGPVIVKDDIVKERRRLSVNKVMDTVFQVLEKSKDTRISKEEFLSAIMLHADLVRFFDRIGYLVMTTNY